MWITLMQHNILSKYTNFTIFCIRKNNSKSDHIGSTCKPESLITFDCGNNTNTSKHFTQFQNTILGFQLGMIRPP
jgi:hypothetical protein